MTIRRWQRAPLSVAAALAACAASAGVANGETITKVFGTAGEHAFVVPAGVTTMQVTLVGGHGAAGVDGGPGGAGATATATLSVTPGETLFAEVGASAPSVGPDSGPGGFGGGSSGGEHNLGFASYAGGGGGGGASDLRTCSEAALQSTCPRGSSLLSRLIVAGGGGGGGGAGGEGTKPTVTGGAGGSAEETGLAGGEEPQHMLEGGSPGKRGTEIAGGAGGGPSADCPGQGGACAGIGTLGIGGNGGTGLSGGGGGGGGGIFGGGGGGGGAAAAKTISEYFNGGGGGGGGGSSGVPSGATGVSNVLLLATAEGAEPSVAIGWSAPPPTVMTGAASAILPTIATLNGSVDTNEWQPTDCSFAISPAPSGVPAFPCAQQLSLGSSPTAVSATAAGLTPGTTYTVTLTASSTKGTSTGAPITFTTPTAVSTATALTVTNLALAPSRFRRGTRPATIVRRKAKPLPSATTISFTVSQAATVTVSFEALEAGVRVGHRCVAISKRDRKGKACKRDVAVPHHLTLSAGAGADRIAFDGILSGGSPLTPGSYRLSLTASNASGKATASEHPSFTLVG